MASILSSSTIREVSQPSTVLMTKANYMSGANMRELRGTCAVLTYCTPMVSGNTAQSSTERTQMYKITVETPGKDDVVMYVGTDDVQVALEVAKEEVAEVKDATITQVTRA